MHLLGISGLEAMYSALCMVDDETLASTALASRETAIFGFVSESGGEGSCSL